MHLGDFNRLGLGIDGAMLMSNINTSHATFSGMPEANAESLYSLGMIGPLVNIALFEPTNRFLNVHAGCIIPYLFPQERITVHPYLFGKVYMDLNKAFFLEIKYVDYTLNVADYVFNPYGNASEVFQTKEYQKILYSLGIMVSF
jgi:hypothetical protein